MAFKAGATYTYLDDNRQIIGNIFSDFPISVLVRKLFLRDWLHCPKTVRFLSEKCPKNVVIGRISRMRELRANQNTFWTLFGQKLDVLRINVASPLAMIHAVIL